jgi:hypothetical protein
VQAHILIGEILERIAVPKSFERAPPTTDTDAAATPPPTSLPSPGLSRVRAIVKALYGRAPAAA